MRTGRRTRFFLAFILLGLSVTPALALLIQNEPSGFRGNHWGASPKDCPSLTFIKSLGVTESGQQVDVYDRSPVGISLNGATPTRIRYRFLDNKLESVQLSYEGRANRDRLLQVMEDRYGRLTPGERRVVSRNEWDGFETTVVLSFNTDTEVGSLWFLSTKLNHEYTEYRYWGESK
ncbi:MAG TPA: hypothetical protein VGJ57_04225 [Nitrospirales bacterium]|jgi:hypothetical protein